MREPWAVNYVVGAAIETLERLSLMQTNIEVSSEVIVTLVQTVTGASETPEATALMEAGKRSSSCGEAIDAALFDSDASATDDYLRWSLVRWLIPRVRLKLPRLHD
jgi:hypothetical protein